MGWQLAPLCLLSFCPCELISICPVEFLNVNLLLSWFLHLRSLAVQKTEKKRKKQKQEVCVILRP